MRDRDTTHANTARLKFVVALNSSDAEIVTKVPDEFITTTN